LVFKPNSMCSGLEQGEKPLKIMTLLLRVKETWIKNQPGINHPPRCLDIWHINCN
jgi:hypothetical protein